jgi:hypothetical protein
MTSTSLTRLQSVPDITGKCGAFVYENQACGSACRNILKMNHQIEAALQQIANVKSMINESTFILGEVSKLKMKTDENGEAVEFAQ